MKTGRRFSIGSGPAGLLRFASGQGLGPFLVRSIAGTAAVRIAAMVASFLVSVQLARGLGVEGYGVYGIGLAVVTLAGIPSEMGVPRLITREVATAAARNDAAKLFAVLRWGNRICLRLSASIALVIAASALVIWGTGSTLALVLIAGAPIVVLETMARLRGGALQGLHFVVLGQIPANLLRPALLSVLLFALYLAGAKVVAPAAMALYMLATAVAFIAAHFLLKRRLPPAVPEARAESGRGWFASSLAMALADGMRTAQAELSILMIGLIAAPAAVALFRIGSATAMMAAVAFFIVARVALPVMARLYAQDDHDRLQKVVTAFAWTQLGGVVILSLPLLVAAEPLLRLVFGEDYVGSAPVLRIIALGQIINSGFGMNAGLLNMTGNERRVTRAMAVALCFTLISVPVMVLWAGIAGAAGAYVASLLVWNLITWRDARRIVGIDTSVLSLWAKRAG